MDDYYNHNSNKHHEDNDSFCSKFENNFKTLVIAIPVNPFQIDNLCKINNKKYVVPDEVFHNNVKTLEKMGDFVYNRLVSQKVPVSDPIPNNNINIWEFHSGDESGKPYIPSNTSLSIMRSACQYRPNMATTIFNHEILNIPQSLFTNNISMYHGTMSDILKKSSSHFNSQVPLYASNSAIIIEMAPLIRAKCSNLGDISCFSDLATLLFHHIENLGSTFARVDLIFDLYFEDSLKEATRDKRGQGSRFFFDGDTPLRKTLGNDFLLNSQNKNNLNEFLAQKFIRLHNTPNILIVTYRDTVFLSSNSELLSLDTQGITINDRQSEEADQRIVRHTLHCLSDCYQFKQVIIHTIDTEILMLIVSNIDSLNITPNIYVKMLKNQNFYNIKEITSFIGLTICKAMPFFYSLYGCDTTSSFFKRGKCKIWDTWHNSRHKDEITSVFTKLSDMNILE